MVGWERIVFLRVAALRCPLMYCWPAHIYISNMNERATIFDLGSKRRPDLALTNDRCVRGQCTLPTCFYD